MKMNFGGNTGVFVLGLHLTFEEHAVNMQSMIQTYYEFFSGGGMARLGLGPEWRCLLANDIDEKKAATYIANFGDGEMICKNVYGLSSCEMLGSPALAWASFPCQDLSLAGNRSGLAGERSGAFWGFWSAIHKLRTERRAPAILVLENVAGTLTSNDGHDFVEICSAVSNLGYNFGAVIVDAINFVPQSRPRLFIVCSDMKLTLPKEVIGDGPDLQWHPHSVRDAVQRLPPHLRALWNWWRLPTSPVQTKKLSDLLEPDHKISKWHTTAESNRLLEMMSATNQAKVQIAKNASTRVVGTIYRRMRVESGSRVQRAEVRFDGIAGCLRTPGGGSSRQIVVVVEGRRVKTRLLSVREAARLMGVPDSYRIPENYNEGYHVFGDGLAVPTVRFLENHLLKKIVASNNRCNLVAA